jgi:lipopolysaccharide transport system permease protein
MSETIIRPRRWLGINWRELREYRELFYYFGWRDIKVRYKQTLLGAGWAIFQPFITMVVFTLFFNKVAGIQATNAVPYAIFSYTGLIFWQYFSAALTRSSNSLVDNQGVVTKVYFPRLIPPISATVLPFIDFLCAFVIFAGLMVYFHITPTLLGILLIPAMLGVSFLAASGAGLLLAAINVKYRDVRQALPFFIQTLLFLTPVIYPSTIVPERFQDFLYINPMAGVISTMRATLIHDGSISWEHLQISIMSAVAMFVVGLIYFKSREREFADII